MTGKFMDIRVMDDPYKRSFVMDRLVLAEMEMQDSRVPSPFSQLSNSLALF